MSLPMPMRTPPTDPGVVELRPAGVGDLDAVDALEGSAFDFDRFPRRNLRRLLVSPSAAVVLAEAAGEAAGYAAMLFRTGSKIARLYSLAVAPAFQGRQIARALLEAGEATARRRGCERLRLEFRASNKTAQRLYERAGFEVMDARPGYYSDGETAIRMEKRLVSGDQGDRGAQL